MGPVTARAPLAAVCARCGARVLEVRWDHYWDTLIGTPLLDPVALDQQQIVACVITRVRLWQLQLDARGWRTSHRGPYWPPHPVPGHVLPEHRCGHAWDAFPVDLSGDTPTYPDIPPF
ncbi:hypothetical protein ACIGCK_04930 [Microbacterium sp. NPDC078428]|uniref:hypothetical protein n=1 Tax=Microbacterium sp. NPDC078428 TaxID=3364190 RepID=UPI0037CB91BA